MGFFDEQMPAIKLGALDDIPCSGRKVSGGRAIKARKYPNRDGQRSEDLGRDPYVFELEIPLFADVDPDHYPTMAEELRAILDDPEDGLEYRDHELGTMPVSIGPWTMDLDAKIRDGVVIRLQLTEDQVDVTSQLRELSATTPNAEDAGATLDDELEEANITEPNVVAAFNARGVGLSTDERSFAAGSMWSTQATRVLQRINDGVATAEQIASYVDTVRGRVDVLLGLPAMQDPANGSAMIAAILFLEAVTLLGDRASAQAAVEVEEVVLDVVSVFDIAARLYGDEQRAVEIMQRNPGVNPLFIARGTVLQVAAT